jgi:hypothetical protein
VREVGRPDAVEDGLPGLDSGCVRRVGSLVVRDDNGPPLLQQSVNEQHLRLLNVVGACRSLPEFVRGSALGAQAVLGYLIGDERAIGRGRTIRLNDCGHRSLRAPLRVGCAIEHLPGLGGFRGVAVQRE